MALANSNLSYSMVANTIGEGSKDLVNLCTNPNINPWSKWKPIISDVKEMDSTELDNKFYGIKFIEKYNWWLDKLYDAVVANGGVGYVYEKPTVLSNCRLGDFRNYEHNAAEPVAPMFKDHQTIEVSKKTKTIITSAQSISSPTTIGYDDLVRYVGAKTPCTHDAMFLIDGKLMGRTINGEMDWLYNDDLLNKNNVTVFEYITYGYPKYESFLPLPHPIHTINIKEVAEKKVYKAMCILDASYKDATLSKVFINLRFTGKGSNDNIEVTGGQLTNVGVTLTRTDDIATDITGRTVAKTMMIEKDKDFVSNTIITSFYLDNLTKQNHVWVNLFWDNQLQQQVQLEWMEMMKQSTIKEPNK